MSPSQELINAVRCSHKRSYKIAFEAGMHPSTLSKLINGIEQVKPNDERVISVGRVLGFEPGECFREGAEND